MNKVAVLGAGTFGCALSNTIIENNEVYCWTHNEVEKEFLDKNRYNKNIKDVKLDERIVFTTDLEVVNECDILLFVVPSFAIREVSKKVNEILESKKIIVIATKGLEADSMKSGYDIALDEINLIDEIVILSGPSHAEELIRKMYTTLVSTSNSKSARELIQKSFSTSYLRIYTNDDVRGVEILGAAKNVLAIAAGVCDGSEVLGDNAKAAILTRGLRELKEIGEFENCKTSTFDGLTGLGDLMVTAMSVHSRNRRFGELVGSGLSVEEAKKEIGMVVEGLYSVSAIHQLMEKYNLELPIIELIYQGIYEDLDVSLALSRINEREQKDE